jgi:hypothetical protein
MWQTTVTRKVNTKPPTLRDVKIKDLVRARETPQAAESQKNSQVAQSGCYILFTMNEHGTHAHITVTHAPHFPTPEERYDQLGPFALPDLFDGTEAQQRIVQAMNDWLAQPLNVNWLRKSNTPVAIFHDERAKDSVLSASVPQQILECIHQSKAIFAKVFDLDPIFIPRYCKY